jgi:long-chain fatty acid transport protein
VHGSGFAIFTHGSTPLGQGNSVIAHTEDASTVFFNPALVVTLDGTRIQAGTTLLIPSYEFDSDFSGNSSSAEDEVFYPSTFFITHKYNDNVSLGLGVFSPFGLSTEWPDTWEGRYIATKSELITYTVNPVVAFRVTPRVAVAAGIDMLFADAELNKMINLSALGVPDINQRLEGDDSGLGFNLGLLVDINDDISFGASYRSSITVDISGDISHDLPAGIPGMIAQMLPDTSAQTSVELPAQAYAGIVYKGIERLTVEIGGKWEEWSSFDELAIESSMPVLGFNQFVYPRKWDNVFSFNAGGEYRVNENIGLLLGYIFDHDPIPDSTFEPAIPGNDAHLYTAGIKWQSDTFKVGVSYAYQDVKERDKENSIDDNPFDGVLNPATSANGRYSSDAHMIGLGISYIF